MLEFNAEKLGFVEDAIVENLGRGVIGEELKVVEDDGGRNEYCDDCDRCD
ncbi:17956_t:CDS:1, partial [Racocetra fulgida]